MSFYDNEDFGMPVLCQRCHDIFDLHDGRGSDKWYPGTVICRSCATEEQKEIERDERLSELYDAIEDALWTVGDCSKQLKDLNAPPKRPTTEL